MHPWPAATNKPGLRCQRNRITTAAPEARDLIQRHAHPNRFASGGSGLRSGTRGGAPRDAPAGPRRLPTAGVAQTWLMRRGTEGRHRRIYKGPPKVIARTPVASVREQERHRHPPQYES